MPISDFQSQFSMSKIVRIFLNLFLIEEYQFRGMFFVNDIFWKLQFLKHFKADRNTGMGIASIVSNIKGGMEVKAFSYLHR